MWQKGVAQLELQKEPWHLSVVHGGHLSFLGSTQTNMYNLTFLYKAKITIIPVDKIGVR